MDDRYDYQDGQFVSRRVAQVVQAIREYSPELDVQWVPPAQRDANTAAFRIVHNAPNREPYVVMHVKNEDEFDARVLKELIMGDQRNGSVSVSQIEAAEEAAKRIAHQRWLDEMEEAHEIAASVFRSSKSTYKVNKDLVIKDYLPGNHASRPKHL